MTDALDRAPRRILLDTDMGGDCDDAGALAILHAMCDLGEASLLGVVCCTSARYTPGCIDAINHYYGRPEIPVGTIEAEGFMADTDRAYSRQVAETFPNKIRTRDNAEKAVKLLRRVLAAQPTASADLVAIGPLPNLAHLMDSEPDEISSLNGRSLVAQKVRELTIMGGFFGESKPHPGAGEYNFANDAPAAATVAKDWPTPILYCGWEIGNACPTGSKLTGHTPEANPVRKAYELYLHGPDRARPSFDLATVYAAVRGCEPLWKESAPGRCIVDPKTGQNTWEDLPTGKDRYMVPLAEISVVAERIEELLIQAPARRQN